MRDNRAPTTAAAVANAFLDLQSADSGSYPRIDQMKLYKLVYYAQAWWLAQKGYPLFDEDIEAWPWGPVVRALYSQFHTAGRDPIHTQRATVLQEAAAGGYGFTYVEPKKPEGEVMDFLKQVWEVHKPYTGVQLSNATHAPGEPWTIVKNVNGDLGNKPLIPLHIIEQVFRGKSQVA